jgi:poly(hydroxyalkanoate) depolymerase family esterase
MAARVRKSLWARSFQRALRQSRANLRAGARAAMKIMVGGGTRTGRPVARKSPTGAGTWTGGVAVGAAGARRYRLYRPPVPRLATRLPLLVMLHGCQQDADSFARSTRLQALAAREGFMLLFPEQERLANPRGCWNWFATSTGRAFTEAASIVAAIDEVCARDGADPARVAVTGLSAGAGMAALLALRYPDRFAAVAMHSGVGPGAAHSVATAFGAMQGRYPPRLPLRPPAALPPLLVIQGTADAVVHPGNGSAVARLWAEAAGARATAPRALQRGARHPVTMTDFRHRGRIVATLCEVSGLGHAWSGGTARQPFGDPRGPDASRMVWAFVQRQFARPTAT